MSYCPKCGTKVDPTMTFCPNCGAPLKPETASQPGSTSTYPPYYRHRHHEKDEKHDEKHGEKYEKGGSGVGYLIGGIVIVVIGLLAYINATTNFFHGITGQEASAIFLVIVGILIVVAGIYYSSRSRRRNPTPT